MTAILNSYTLFELKKEISKQNVKGYSKMRKADLIALMLHKDHAHKFSHLKHKVKQPKSKIRTHKPAHKPAPKPTPKPAPKTEMELYKEREIAWKIKQVKETKKRLIYYSQRREEYLIYAKRLIDKLSSIKLKNRNNWEKNVLKKTRRQAKSVQKQEQYWHVYLDKWVDDMEDFEDTRNKEQIKKYIEVDDLKVNNNRIYFG
jgi:hypothetical protein